MLEGIDKWALGQYLGMLWFYLGMGLAGLTYALKNRPKLGIFKVLKRIRVNIRKK